MAIVQKQKQRITLAMRSRSCYESKQIRGAGRKFAEGLIKDYEAYRPGVTLDVERPRLITKAYKMAEGEPMVLVRAKALAYLMDNKELYILPDERVVGNITARPNGILHYPEMYWRWVDKAIDDAFKPLLTEEERKELHQIHLYWKNRAVHGMERDLLPDDVKPYWFYDNHGALLWRHGGHIGTPNFVKIFEVGINGIIKELKDKQKELQAKKDVYLNAREYVEQRRWVEAAIIVHEAAARFGKRFAKKAHEEAEKETNPDRKKELEEMARICDRVPADPPSSFHEGLQCYWFITMISRLFDMESSGYGDRIDQIFYPLYKRDKELGKITAEQAQELMEHLFLKMNEEGGLTHPTQMGQGGGLARARVLTVGGLDSEGKDATNELSYICMDAAVAIGLAFPTIGVRLHHNTPVQFLRKITQSVRARAGVFAFFSDEMMIPYLLNKGIPIQDARSYGVDGCMRWIIAGKSLDVRAHGGVVVLPKIFEYVMTQGLNKFNGKQIGYSTPDPLTFKSIEDVIRAYEAQLSHFMGKLATIYNITDVLHEEALPRPFVSALMDDCRERMQDCSVYKYFPNTIVMPVGQITVANSLAAIKKLVFDDKKVSMAELVEALKHNWEGKEELRKKFVEAPKFGNDDDYVDSIAADLILRTTQVIHSFKNTWGGPFLEDGSGGASFYQYSDLTGATPDGRKDRDLFNDGTVSPTPGSDHKGPTAVLNSVAKIDHARTFTHLFNQKFFPSCLEGKNEEKFCNYLQTFADLKIHHIQFNVMDRETLLDAQKHPENYADLVVRVAGFTAYWVDLLKPVQDQILARTEQKF